MGRNLLDGRWTFQMVDEFDDLYQPVRTVVKGLERDLVQGARHVFEAEMKEERRTKGRIGRERRPPTRSAWRIGSRPGATVAEPEGARRWSGRPGEGAGPMGRPRRGGRPAPSVGPRRRGD